MQKKILFLLTMVFLLSLSSCCDVCPRQPLPPCGEFIEAVNAQGAFVIPKGDTLRIIVPVDNFFEPASTRIRPSRMGVFVSIAELVQCQCYQYFPIHVSGYTDNVGTIRDQKSRSYRQAHAVAAFLWSNGIPYTRMSIQRFGARGTIASNETPLGSAYNRRVEITLP